MDNFNQEPTRFIFYLQFAKQLPRYYFQLANILSYYNIQVVPVSLDQLREMASNRNKMVVIVGETDLQTRGKMRKALKSSLGVMMRYRKISLFHISSFEKNLELAPTEKSNNYYFVRLPESYELIVQQVCYFLAENLNVINKWPGGRRAKLPSA